MRYRLVEAVTVSHLNDQVDDLLENGWDLHGELIISPSGMFYRELTFGLGENDECN